MEINFTITATTNNTNQEVRVLLMLPIFCPLRPKDHYNMYRLCTFILLVSSALRDPAEYEKLCLRTRQIY